jgi:hypothetical protein
MKMGARLPKSQANILVLNFIFNFCRYTSAIAAGTRYEPHHNNKPLSQKL